jgi:hypothetical protein
LTVTDVANNDSQQEFARALGDALLRFLDSKAMGQAEAARLLGLKNDDGKARRSTLNSYLHDSPNGMRTEASAQVLYLACARLGFHLDYAGYRLKAVKLSARDRKSVGQLAFNFHRRFDLVGKAGNLNVKVKKPNGRIELSISLDAKASSQRHE